jgi:hypothetical protein
VTSARPAPINDDHGDQFPGALPARTTTAPSPGASERLVRMRSAYVRANPAVAADRAGPAHEPEQTPAGAPLDRGRRVAGRPTPSRGQSGRRPRPAGSRIGSFTQNSLERFDRYTLEVFNPGAPYRTRNDHSA